MCKYDIAQKISGAVVWIPKRAAPNTNAYACDFQRSRMTYKELIQPLVEQVQEAGRVKLQRALKEWPWCPEGGNVNLEWTNEGGQRTWRGYFKCDKCQPLRLFLDDPYYWTEPVKIEDVKLEDVELEDLPPSGRAASILDWDPRGFKEESSPVPPGTTIEIWDEYRMWTVPSTHTDSLSAKFGKGPIKNPQ